MLLTIIATSKNVAKDRSLKRDEARLEREHAASKAHHERVATTRREVYLEAVESLGKAQMLLGGLAQRDLRNLDIASGMGPMLSSVGKIAVIGEIPTVTLARDLTSDMHVRLFRALVFLLPMAGYKGALEVHHTDWEGAQVELRRLVAAMVNHNESLNKDPEAFAALAASFEAQQKRSARAADLEQEAYAKIHDLQLRYGEFVFEGSKEIALRLDELIDCIRRELNIESDFEAFRQQTLRMQAAVASAIAEMNAGIQTFKDNGAATS